MTQAKETNETYSYGPRRTSRHGNDMSYHGTRSIASKRMSLDRGRSASPSDNGIIQIGQDGLSVALIQDYDDAVMDTIGRWANSASVGAPPERVMATDAKAFLSGGLAFQSLEDIRIAFGVRGASRVLTHQLVRTRQGAFKQQSQRDCFMGEAPEFRMPESVWMDRELRNDWIDTLIAAHRAYSDAIYRDIPYEDARYILPEGTTNFIMCEYSMRTFMDMYAYRGCVMFQDEMVWVQRAMRQLLVQAHPYLEPHIKISCEKIHKCTFQGADRIEEQCDFPWATEDNRTHKPAKYIGED